MLLAFKCKYMYLLYLEKKTNTKYFIKIKFGSATIINLALLCHAI